MNLQTKNMSKNEKKVFLIFSIAIILFICFLVFYHIYDIHFYDAQGIGCGFKRILHLYCPGCGGTRATDAFLHGSFLESFLYQPVIIYLFLYFLTYYIPAALLFLGIRKKKINYMFYIYPLWGLLILVVLYFVGRNLLMVYGGYDYIGECLPYWQ